MGDKDENYAPHLLNGLQLLWQEKTFCDTTLVVQRIEIGVHRCVLAAVSPYFRALLAGSLKESFQHERIELKEVSPEIVRNLVDYCYTGRISIDQESVMSVLKTADLLQFDTVRHLCSEFLIGQLSPENCVDMAQLAHDLGMWNLKEKARLFLLHNIGDCARLQPNFFALDFDAFEAMLLDHNLKVPKEETVVELIVSWVLFDRPGRVGHIPRLLGHVRLPFVRRFYLLQISHYDAIMAQCGDLIVELDMADYAGEVRFKPRLSTGIHEIFVRIGGTNAELDELSVVEGYNPVTQGWRRLSEPLGEPLRGGYTTSALGQDLYICGGRLGDGLVSNKCFRFRPQLDSWSQVNGMLVDREYHASASLGGYLYCISSETAERYDPVSGAWSYITPLPVPCENLNAISAKGILYVVASPSTDDGPGPISLFTFDPSTESWSQEELEPPEPWSVCPLMTSMNGTLYFLGDDSKNLQSFTPESHTWTLLPPSKEVHLGGSVTILEGKVTISGGYASESGLTDTIEQFDPITEKWSVYAKLKEPTFWHGSVAVHKFICPPNSPDFKSEAMDL